MRRSLVLFTLPVLFASCGDANTGAGVDAAPPDLAVAADLATAPDLATSPDLSMPDLAMPDLSMPDLSMPDLSMPDLAMPDLSMPDLVPPPDLKKLPAPTLASVTPACAANNGGTALTIGGTNFAVGATLTVGGQAATNVVVKSGTSLTATLPADPKVRGLVPVVVQNIDSQSASRSDLFTYRDFVSFKTFVPYAAHTAPRRIALGDLRARREIT